MTDAKDLKNTVREFTSIIFTLGQRQIFQYMDETGLSRSQLMTLGRLYAHSGAGISAMGAHLGTTDAAASQLIDRLVNQGLVERQESPEDRRKKQVLLTDKGKAIIEGMSNQRTVMVNQILAHIPPEKQSLIGEALTIMIDASRAVEREMGIDTTEIAKTFHHCAKRSE